MLADILIVGRCGVGDATRLNIGGGKMRGSASKKLEKTVGNSSVCLCQCPCLRSTTACAGRRFVCLDYHEHLKHGQVGCLEQIASAGFMCRAGLNLTSICKQRGVQGLFHSDIDFTKIATTYSGVSVDLS